MKRIVCIILSLLLLLVFAACDGEKPAAEAGKYVFAQGDITIGIDAPAEPILQRLGEPKSYDESPSCAFDGLDKVYVFAGFKLETYPQDGKDYVSGISLLDDSVATPEGVTIGTEKARVLELYGTPDEEGDSNRLVYRDESNDMSLQFLLRDGKVTNIQYLKTIETE